MSAIDAFESLRSRRAAPYSARVWHAVRTLCAHYLTRIVRLDDVVGDQALTDAFIELAVRQSSPVYRDVRIERRVVQLDEIHPLSRFVSTDRLDVAETYLTAARSRSILLFEPTCVRRFGERTYHVTLPPVVEPWGDGYAVIDGVHRLGALWVQGAAEAMVVSLIGDHLPKLPGRPATWEGVRVQRKYVSRHRKFKRWRPDLFRPTASYFRSSEFEFRSLSAIAKACRRAAQLDRAPAPPSEFWCRKHRQVDQCNAPEAGGGKLRRHAQAVVGE